jgi:hypothetical protein
VRFSCEPGAGSGKISDFAVSDLQAAMPSRLRSSQMDAGTSSNGNGMTAH